MASASRTGPVKEPVKVYLRLRPLAAGSSETEATPAVQVVDKRRASVSDPDKGDWEANFDGVFKESATQDEVFNESCRLMPRQLLDGFDCSVVAYGPTNTGKTHTLLGHRKPSDAEEVKGSGAENSSNDTCIVDRLASDLFAALEECGPGSEFTIRCSVVEIYLNRIRDLLVESNCVHVRNGRLAGCSRLSCFSAQDIINIVKRARGVRTSSAVEPNRDSSRSSLVVQVEVEQVQHALQKSLKSNLLLFDLVGSEISSAPSDGDESSEPVLVSKSLQFLQRHIGDVYNGSLPKIPDTAPVVAQLLSNSVGGSSYTSLLLTASPSSTALRETTKTINFGQNCQKVVNTPCPSIQDNEQDLNMRLKEAEAKHARLEELSQALAGECKRLYGKSGKHAGMDIGLEAMIDDIVEGAAEHRELAFTIETKKEHQIRTEQMKLKSEMRRATEARDEALNKHRQLSSDMPILRSQTSSLQEEVKRLRDELSRAKNENTVLRQRNTEVEHSLRTSQFRENEAVVFLRQLRRFYYRLLRKMAAEGSGNFEHIIGHIPGAPDLTQLVDIDHRLMECGLLEKDEVGKDALGDPKPSEAALSRSKEAAAEMLKASTAPVEGAGDGKPSVEISDTAPLPTSIVKREESAAATEARQKLYGTPSGRYVAMREQVLEEELLQLAERSIQLQKQYEEEKVKADALAEHTETAAALERLKTAKETKTLKNQLQRKENDLNAVVLKMNELHLTGKTLASESANKDEYLSRIEESLAVAQATNSSLAREKERDEKKIMEDNLNLRAQLENVTTPVWQLDDRSEKIIPMRCRIVAPFAPENQTPKDSTRRDSLGGEGEWMVDPSTIEYMEAETQTELSVVDAEAQTDPTCLDQETTNAEVQTDPISFDQEKEVVHMETQTDPVSISLEQDTKEAEVQTDPTPLGQLIGDAETLTNDDGTCILCGVAADAPPPAAAAETNVDDFLFMDESPIVQKASVVAKPSERIALSVPDSLVEDVIATKTSDQKQNQETNSQGAALSDGHPIEEDTNGEVNGVESTPEPGDSNDGPAENKSEKEPKKNDEPPHHSKLSSFMEKLRSQAKKKDDTDDEESSVPEFMRKFRKIGTRNMGESIIETSGAKSGQDGATPAPSSSWTPRVKKKSDDDSSSSSDDSFAKSFMAGSGSSHVPNQPAPPTQPDGDSSDEEAEPAPSVHSTSTPVPVQPEISSKPAFGKRDDSDSDDSSDDENDKPPPQAPPVPVTKKTDDSDSESSDEDKKEAPTPAAPPAVVSKPMFGKNDDSDSDSDSDSDDEKKKPSPAPAAKPAVAGNNSDSDSSDSSHDDTEQVPAPTPSPAPEPAPKTGTSDSADSDSDSDGEDATTKPVAAPTPTPKKPSDDSDSSESSTADSDDEPKKIVATPAPAEPKKAAGDSDDDSSDSSEEKPAPPKVTPPAPKAGDSDSSESSTADSDDEPKKVVEIPAAEPPPPTKKADSDSDSDSDDSSDDEDKEPPPKPAAAPVAAKQADSDSDGSSSIDSDMESVQKATPQPSKKVDSDSDSDDASDDDEPPPKPAAPIARKRADSSSSDESSSADSDNEPAKVAPVAAKPPPRKDSSDSSDDSSSGDDDDDAKKPDPIAAAFGSDPIGDASDFGDKAKTNNEASKKQEGKSGGKAKFVMKGGKLVKVGADSDVPDEKPSSKAKFVVRGGKLVKEDSKSTGLSAMEQLTAFNNSKSGGFDVVQGGGALDGSQSDWGKSPIPSSPRRAKSNFVIKGGKLVKEGGPTSPQRKPPAKTGSASFKIVGGKLVKDGDKGGKKPGKKGSTGKKGEKKKAGGEKKKGGKKDSEDGKKKKKKKFGMF